MYAPAIFLSALYSRRMAMSRCGKSLSIWLDKGDGSRMRAVNFMKIDEKRPSNNQNA